MKKDKPFSQKLIPWIILAVMIYTIADIILQAFYCVEISPTLTTCYFAFWGTEIIGLATIKNVKVKNENKEVKILDTKDDYDIPDISILDFNELEDK